MAFMAPPNGSRLSRGRNARRRKAVDRQRKRLAGEATQFFPHERPAASKRLLGSRIRHLSRVTSRQHEQNHSDHRYKHTLNETLRRTELWILHVRWPEQAENRNSGAETETDPNRQGHQPNRAVDNDEQAHQGPYCENVSPFRALPRSEPALEARERS